MIVVCIRRLRGSRCNERMRVAIVQLRAQAEVWSVTDNLEEFRGQVGRREEMIWLCAIQLDDLRMLFLYGL